MKKIVFFTVMLLMFVSSVIAEERLTLSIGGELMERDMPQDIEEAQDLIRYLLDIANKADEKIENDYVQNLAEVESYKRQNEILQMKLEKLESKLNDISETNLEVKFDVDSILKQNTRCTFLFGMGPVIGSDTTLGFHLNALGSYRLFYNVHIGAELFSDIYQNTNRNCAFGIGLVVGYSLY